MSASDLAALALLLAATTAACDDPTLTRRPPELASMTLFLVLDPDAEVQPLLAKPASAERELAGLHGEVRRDGASVATAAGGSPQENAHLPCVGRYGPVTIAAHCLAFAFRPAFGGTYSVAASADGYPSAAATTRVPGDFTITAVEAEGDPPGTGALRVAWTRSEGAYRYVVALRPSTLPPCVEMRSCEQGWSVATRDTTIHTAVPAAALAGAGGPWQVDVYAMDEAVYQYLTTGSTGNLFPVGAVQNVSGGYGAVGSWVRRSREL
jgi:hypothetical protein